MMPWAQPPLLTKLGFLLVEEVGAHSKHGAVRFGVDVNLGSIFGGSMFGVPLSSLNPKP